ncbi:Uncharacterised protein [Vibrio cholerae]|nr:Uncharacterised protein [Vibrio cholerae]
MRSQRVPICQVKTASKAAIRGTVMISSILLIILRNILSSIADQSWPANLMRQRTLPFTLLPISTQSADRCYCQTPCKVVASLLGMAPDLGKSR